MLEILRVDLVVRGALPVSQGLSGCLNPRRPPSAEASRLQILRSRGEMQGFGGQASTRSTAMALSLRGVGTTPRRSRCPCGRNF